MKHTISGNETDLEIAIEETQGNAPKVLAALQECAEGRCTCPTRQYEKLEAIDIAPHAEGVTVRLKARSGEKIDRSEIEQCLAYTAGQVRK